MDYVRANSIPYKIIALYLQATRVNRTRMAGVQKNTSKISHHLDANIERLFQKRSVTLIQLAESLKLCELSE
jgi:hypothetical protein